MKWNTLLAVLAAISNTNSSGYAQVVPDTVLTGHNSRRIVLGNGRGKLEIGGGIYNYKTTGGTWKKGSNDIVIWADTSQFGKTIGSSR